MLTYQKIKESTGVIEIKKDSRDAWFLGEVVNAIGVDTTKSKFDWTEFGLDTRIDSGVVVFKNGVEIRVS